MNKTGNIKSRIAVIVSMAGLIGSLAGCGGMALSGRTYYSVSAINGDETTISFDGNTWRMTENDNWYSGTWQSGENGSIILGSSQGEVISLNPIEGSDGYQYAGEEKLGTRFYPSKKEAKDATRNFTDNLPNTVMDYLESSDWNKEVSSDSSCKQPETISFSEGKANFLKGVYEQGNAIFHQGPNDGDWGAEDHSGEYDVTVETFSRVNTSNNVLYTGFLTIGNAETEYKLEVLSDSKSLTLDNNMYLVFTAEESE